MEKVIWIKKIFRMETVLYLGLPFSFLTQAIILFIQSSASLRYKAISWSSSWGLRACFFISGYLEDGIQVSTCSLGIRFFSPFNFPRKSTSAHRLPLIVIVWLRGMQIGITNKTG